MTHIPHLDDLRFTALSDLLTDGDLTDPIIRKIVTMREQLKRHFIMQKGRTGTYPANIRLNWPKDEAETYVCLTLPSYLSEIAKRPVGVTYDSPLWAGVVSKSRHREVAVPAPRSRPHLWLVGAAITPAINITAQDKMPSVYSVSE